MRNWLVVWGKTFIWPIDYDQVAAQFTVKPLGKIVYIKPCSVGCAQQTESASSVRSSLLEELLSHSKYEWRSAYSWMYSFLIVRHIWLEHVYILCGMAQMYSSKIQIFSLAVMFSGRRDDGAETVDSALCLHADHLWHVHVTGSSIQVTFFKNVAKIFNC